MTHNPETLMTLDDAVAEVLGLLTGLDLQYVPELDRYQAITRALNRALRAVALEREWAWYADLRSIGQTTAGVREMFLPATVRPRITGDDAVRLVDAYDAVRGWAYFLPRDAIHKYEGRNGLWVAALRNSLYFSRCFTRSEGGLDVRVPVMREPTMFRLPPMPEDSNDPVPTVPDSIREQPVDFAYPDLVIARAAYFYAQTDPIMQPRVQTLEKDYKDLMYQLIERDERHTDSPYSNEFFVPIESGINPVGHLHRHPHSDERRF